LESLSKKKNSFMSYVSTSCSFFLNRFFKFLTTKKSSIEQPAGTFYSTDSFSDFEELGYQAKNQKKLSRICLKFKGNPKWEWPFLNQTDPLLKYSMSMALVVLITLFIIQVLNRS
jgi:hypothetical protein